MNNPEYYKCINTAGCDNQFTLNKIYKIFNFSFWFAISIHKQWS